MRQTSFRRRSGLRVVGKVGGSLATSSSETDITMEGDDDSTVVCVHCDARVRRLTNGRPAAHAPGGVRANTRNGAYKCAGSGNV